MKHQILMAAVLVGVASATSAFGTIVATDSYVIGSNPSAGQYTVGALNAEPGTLVNTGFVNGGYASGIGTANFQASATGLDYASVSGESGGGVIWVNPGSRDNVNRSVARNLSPAVTSASISPFYESFELSRGDLSTAAATDSFVGTGFAYSTFPVATASSTVFGSFVGFSGATAGDPTANFGSLVIRSRSGTSAFTADTILVDGATTSTVGTTYFVVTKNIVNSPTDSIEYWVNPTDVTSDGQMTATAIKHGLINTASSPQGGYPFQGDANDLLRLNYVSRNWDGSATFDEPRLGTTLADVAVQAIPEPTTLAAAAGGLIALARRRRSR